jgi:ribosomal protein L11 methyltransferase
MDKTWIRVDIFTTPEGVEHLSYALSELGHNSLSVVDSSDLEKLMEGKYGAWDYIDPELMKLREVETTVTCYVQNQQQGKESIECVRNMLTQLKKSDSMGKFGKLECSTSLVKDENWVDSWKEGYTPIIIGEKLVVCPSWLDYEPDERNVLIISPGMAFGTGIDETTRLCLEVLESTSMEGCSILDIGCGSGILAIGALLLGAKSALGIDIDEIAVKTAKENAEINGVSEKARFVCGNPITIVTESYDIICANIAAAVILKLMPEFPKYLNSGGMLILSGIVEGRKQDIVDVLRNVGLSVAECKEENGWICLVAKG